MEGIEVLVVIYKELMMWGVIIFFVELGIVEFEKEVFFYGVLFDGIFLYYFFVGD